MMFVWRKKRVETPLGLVADFCPICRDLRAFEMFRAEMAGQLLGHVKQCKSCGLKLGTDPDQYTGFEPPTSSNLEVLVARTFPGIWMKFADRLAIEEELRRHPGMIAPEARQGYLMEPFVLFNATVEQCYAGKVPLDLPSTLGGLATIILTGIILCLAAMVEDLQTKDHLFAAMLAVFGVGTTFTLWQLYLRPHRYVRQKVIPSLAVALKPLAPNQQDLESCLEKCRAMRMKVGHVIKPRQIRIVLETPQALPKTVSAATPPKATLSPVLVLLSMLLLGGVVFCYSHFHFKSLSERMHLADKLQRAFAPAPAVPANSGVGFLIPATNRVDMVHDPKRQLLYISAGDAVLRYQLTTHSFLPPLVLGGSLCGLDLSVDGDALLVADAAPGHGTVGLHMVALETGVKSQINFPAEPKETGTFSLVCDMNGAVWITSAMAGGLSPLHKYQPATHMISVLTHVGPETVLAASANREFIAYASLGEAAGNFGWFQCRASKLQPPLQANAPLLDVAINRDGTLLALPNLRDVLLSGAPMPSLNEKAVSVAFHPLKEFLFLSRNNAVEVWNTTNYTLVKKLDFGARFTATNNAASHDGHLRVASDGSLIFCTVPGGVRCAETGL
jgi:hypothetical protein